MKPYRIDEDYRGRNLKDPYKNIDTFCEMYLYFIDNYKYTDESFLVWWNTGSFGTTSKYAKKVLKYAGEVVPYVKEEIITEVEG
jgi:hypothetical protein